MPAVISPQPSIDDAFFWDGVQRGEILYQVCAECARWRHPSGPMCAHCGSLRWQTAASSGKGTLLSAIVPRHPPVADGDERVIALVELDEGPRLVTNISGVPFGDIRPDMAVEFVFVEVEPGLVLPQVQPLQMEEQS